MKITVWANYLRDECGAVTVDWVVLSAAVIGIGMLMLYPIAFATESVTKTVSGNIEAAPVGYGNQ